MSIMLGNLGVKEIERRSGVTFPEVLVEYMAPRHQQNASNVGAGKWHCFDIPFTLVCGDINTASEIYGHLKSLSGDFKEPLHISVTGG